MKVSSKDGVLTVLVFGLLVVLLVSRGNDAAVSSEVLVDHRMPIETQPFQIPMNLEVSVRSSCGVVVASPEPEDCPLTIECTDVSGLAVRGASVFLTGSGDEPRLLGQSDV